ncbi:MAG: L-threonylcarbamoyladenylate synthase [Patescibacteria group bacterium]
MSAKYIKINLINPESNLIKECSDVIKSGGSVVYPTETLYGLGVNVFDDKACSKVFSIKGRDLNKPLIVHIANINDVFNVADNVPDDALKLMKKYWPGPLTIVLKKNKNISDIVSKSDTVGIRIPDNNIELEIIKSAMVPITGTSANLSGNSGIVDPLIALKEMGERVDVVIDGGICKIGKPSTIVDLSNGEIKLLREGAILYSEILDFLKTNEN